MSLSKHSLKRFPNQEFEGATVAEYRSWIDSVVSIQKGDLDRRDLNLAFKAASKLMESLITTVGGGGGSDTNFFNNNLTIPATSPGVLHNANGKLVIISDLSRWQMTAVDSVDNQLVANLVLAAGNVATILRQVNGNDTTAASVELRADGVSLFGGSKNGDIIISTKNHANSNVVNRAALQYIAAGGSTPARTEYTGYGLPPEIGAANVGYVMVVTSATSTAFTHPSFLAIDLKWSKNLVNAQQTFSNSVELGSFIVSPTYVGWKIRSVTYVLADAANGTISFLFRDNGTFTQATTFASGDRFKQQFGFGTRTLALGDRFDIRVGTNSSTSHKGLEVIIELTKL